MRPLVGIAGFMLLFVILWDASETIVLPRRVTRRVRLTRLFYRSTWLPWAVALVVSFATLHWALGSAVNLADGTASFGTDLYMSGTTFFTLGLGDVTPRTPLARLLTVVEAGMGFGFLAIVIGYLPTSALWPNTCLSRFPHGFSDSGDQTIGRPVPGNGVLVSSEPTDRRPQKKNIFRT